MQICIGVGMLDDYYIGKRTNRGFVKIWGWRLKLDFGSFQLWKINISLKIWG